MSRPTKCGGECTLCACGRSAVKCKFTRPWAKSPRLLELVRLAKLRKTKTNKRKKVKK